jgi:hypothetical protein
VPSTTLLEIPPAEQVQMCAVLRRTRYGYLLAFHILLLCAAGRNPTGALGNSYIPREPLDNRGKSSCITTRSSDQSGLSMGCAAKVIVLDDVRASPQRQALRQQLHAHFDRWLAEIEAACPASAPTLAQVSETIWRLRQKLTAGVAQTIVAHTQAAAQRRESLRCTTGERLLRARPAVSRTAQTRIGASEVQRPYFYCPHCHGGRYPLDEVLGLSAGRMHLDVQQAAVDLATALP